MTSLKIVYCISKMLEINLITKYILYYTFILGTLLYSFNHCSDIILNHIHTY